MPIDYDALLASLRAAVAPATDVATLRSMTSGRICPFRPAEEAGERRTLAAVDGGRVQERLYALDLLTATAAAANGKSSPGHPLPEPLTWAALLTRSSSNERLSQTAMAAMEARLLADATHQLRILDGSLLTPLIGVREGLYAKSPDAHNAALHIVEGDLRPLEALASIYRPDPERPVVAVVKADTSRDHMRALRAAGLAVPVMPDRVFASQVLKPGEYLQPVRVNYSSIQQGRSLAPAGTSEVAEVACLLSEASEAGRVLSTFFKPYGSHHAVIKIEYMLAEGQPDPVADHVVALDADCKPPHALEPYAQWKVDRIVKRVSANPARILNGVLARLSEEERRTIGPLVSRGYRT